MSLCDVCQMNVFLQRLEAHLSEEQSQRLREKEKLSNLKKEHAVSINTVTLILVVFHHGRWKTSVCTDSILQLS